MVCCTVKIIIIVKKWNKCWTTCLKIFLYLSHLLTQIVSDLIVIPFNIYCSVGSMPTANNTFQNRCKACTQILQIDTITQRRESILPSVIKFYSSSIPFWLLTVCNDFIPVSVVSFLLHSISTQLLRTQDAGAEKAAA